MKSSNSSFAEQMSAYGMVISALIGIPGVFIGLFWMLMKRNGWPEWTLVFPAVVGMAGAFLQIYRYMQKRWANEDRVESRTDGN